MNQKLISVLAASSVLLFLGCPGPGPHNDGGTGGGTGGSQNTGGGAATGGGQGSGGGVATGGGQGSGGGVATGGGQGTGGGVATGGGQGTGGGAATGGGNTGEDLYPDAGPGSGTLTGDLAFTVAKARALFFQRSDGGLDTSLLQVGLTDVDFGNFCGSSAPMIPLQAVSIAVGTADGGAVLPGTYPLTLTSAFSPSGGANVVRFDFDNGMPTMMTSSSTGTVTFDAISGAAVSGSFDAVLELPGDGGFSALSGTFNAPGCVIGQ